MLDLQDMIFCLFPELADGCLFDKDLYHIGFAVLHGKFISVFSLPWSRLFYYQPGAISEDKEET